MCMYCIANKFNILVSLETILPGTNSDSWDIQDKEKLFYEMVRFIYKNKCYGKSNKLGIWLDFKKKYPNLKISAQKLKDLFFDDIQWKWLEGAPVTIQAKAYCSSIEGIYPERKEVLANNDLSVSKNLRVYSTIKVCFRILLDPFRSLSL